MPRRIDALYCTGETANHRIGDIIAEITDRAEVATREVESAIDARVKALHQRKQKLISQIKAVESHKIEVLQQQLQAIQAGVCPLAPADSQQQELGPGSFLLNEDAVINFRITEDFQDAIEGFGTIGNSSTYASQSYAKGSALGILKVNNPSYLWVYACDRLGEPRGEGGESVVVTLSSPQDFEQVTVEDLKDGRYKVTIVPLQAGEYELRVMLGPEGSEEDVRGGPFPLVVRNPTEYQLIGAGQECEGKWRLGEPTSPGSEGLVHKPNGIAFDSSGRFIFVADQGNHRIKVLNTEDPDCVMDAFGKKGVGRLELDSPSGIVCDRDNTVVVSDLLNHRLQVLQFNPRTGTLDHVRSFGEHGSGPGEFQFPKGLGLTEHGCLLVCDSGNHRVQIFDMRSFDYVRELGQQGCGDGLFTSPLAATVNCSGEVLVSDSNNRVQVFDFQQGTWLRSFGLKGRKDGCLNYPIDMAVNDENALFICDQANHRVQVLNASDGTFLHKWGGSKRKKVEGEEGTEPAEEEGDEKVVEWVGLRTPAGVAVNLHGTIAVSDYHQNKIYAF